MPRSLWALVHSQLHAATPQHGSPQSPEFGLPTCCSSSVRPVQQPARVPLTIYDPNLQPERSGGTSRQPQLKEEQSRKTILSSLPILESARSPGPDLAFTAALWRRAPHFIITAVSPFAADTGLTSADFHVVTRRTGCLIDQR